MTGIRSMARTHLLRTTTRDCDVVGTPTLAGEEAERHTAENSYELVWAAVADFDPFNLQPLQIRGPLADLMTTLDTETLARVWTESETACDKTFSTRIT